MKFLTSPELSLHFPKSTQRWMALCILLCSSFCLIWQLDAKSIWIDELFTVEIVTQPTAHAVIKAVQATEGRPPLYYLLLHYWTFFAGSSDFALRFFSIIPALLCVALVYTLARQLLNPHVGLVTMFLFGFSPMFLLYSRMARAYFTAVCFALLSSYCFIRLLRRSDSLVWTGYLLAACGLLYTDYMTASILLVPNLVLLIHQRTLRKLWGHWALAQIGLGISFIPWLSSLLRHTSRYQGPTRLADLSQGLLGYTVKLVQPFLVFSLGETLHPWNPLAGIGLTAIGLLALLGLWKAWQQKRPEATFIILGTIVPVLFTVFIVTGFFVRYMTFAWVGARTLQALPFYLILVAHGLLAVKLPKRLYIGLLLVVIPLLMADFNYYFDRDFQNPVYVIPSKKIVAQVVIHIGPGDIIIASRDSVFARYYARYNLPNLLFYSNNSQALKNHIEEAACPHIWLVTVNRDRGGVTPSPEFMAWLQRYYEDVDHWGYADVTPGYQRFKTFLTRREAYVYKAELTLYRRRKAPLPKDF